MHDPRETIEPEETVARPYPPALRVYVDDKHLVAQLNELVKDPRLGTFSGVVTNSEDPNAPALWSAQPEVPYTPASTTKIVTAAAALLTLDVDHRLTTAVYSAETPGAVVLKAGGDVMLTNEKLDELAAGIKRAHLEPISSVVVDTSAWSGPNFSPEWDRADIAAGYIAPMEPVMLYGGRIGATEGDVPRSETPALDVGNALAERLGAVEATVQDQPVTTSGEALASVDSDTLLDRLRHLMLHSDNVAAEAVGREIAQAKGNPASSANAVAETKRALEYSFGGIVGQRGNLADNSGLSPHNALTADFLNDLLLAAATDRQPRLRPLLTTLPVAAGSGTLEDRYKGTATAGWVRAKTGTLSKTTALAGTVVSVHGRVYTFAFIANDADVLGSRAAMDAMTTAIQEH